MSAHRPLAYAIDASEPEPWSVAAPAPDTEPDRPGRYSWIAPARLDTGHAHPSAAPPTVGRTCRATDPCIVPPPGSDRRGAAVVVVAAPVVAGSGIEGKE